MSGETRRGFLKKLAVLPLLATPAAAFIDRSPEPDEDEVTVVAKVKDVQIKFSGVDVDTGSGFGVQFTGDSDTAEILGVPETSGTVSDNLHVGKPCPLHHNCRCALHASGPGSPS